MKSRILLLTIITICSIVAVLLQYYLSGRKTRIKNGFERNISVTKPRLIRSIKLGSDLYYIAGWQNGKCYLANPDRPFEILQVKDHVEKTIHIDNVLNVKIKAGKVMIDSPYFYLADLYSYKIYRGDLATYRLEKKIYDNGLFSESIPVNETTIVLRTINKQRTEYELAKQRIDVEELTERPGLIEKQIDGLFCTDGILLFDEALNQIVYTYYYRNQFICADTNLVLLCRGRTIDTVSHARIKVTKIASTGISTLASPPVFVNRAAHAWNGKLLVNSSLVSDNEDIVTFNSSDVVDIYSIPSGNYIVSFYIPRKDNQRIRSLAVRSGVLYVLRGNHMDFYKYPDY